MIYDAIFSEISDKTTENTQEEGIVPHILKYLSVIV